MSEYKVAINVILEHLWRFVEFVYSGENARWIVLDQLFYILHNVA